MAKQKRAADTRGIHNRRLGERREWRTWMDGMVTFAYLDTM